MTDATDFLRDKEMQLDETSSQDSPLRHSIGQGKVGSFLSVSLAYLRVKYFQVLANVISFHTNQCVKCDSTCTFVSLGYSICLPSNQAEESKLFTGLPILKYFTVNNYWLARPWYLLESCFFQSWIF